MNYLFFLLIPFVLIIPAYAETGKNFDTISLDNGLTQWTSHYDRIFNGLEWKNYLISNNPASLEFESANLSFLFDKVSCDFKLLDPESKGIAISGYDFVLNIDGLPTILPICDLESFIQSEDKISFTINRGLFKTLYDMNSSGSMEWTHEIDNNEGKASTFTIIETCTACIVQSIDGNKIDFGSYTLDTKNEVHNTVKDTRADKGDYIIEYEKTILDKEKFSIDPTFSYTTGTVKRVFGASIIGAACPTIMTTTDTTARIYIPTTASDTCTVFAVRWDITSIPDSASIADVSLRYDVDVISNPRNCDFMPMSGNPSTQTNQQTYDDILDGTAFVDNSSQCITVGSQKVLDLGSSANTDVTNNLVDNEWAIGIKPDSMIRDAAPIHQVDFSDIQIQILYNIPGAVTDLVAIDIRGTAVDLDWGQPSLNGGLIQGYQINSTTPWSSNVASVSLNFTNTTSATVQSLTGSTPYSFRIGVWAQGGGSNMTGNVLNITTDFDPTAAFTVGTFNLTQTGTDDRPITFFRDDINSTYLFLNITVDTDWDLACNFHYKFANTNNTYANIANTTIDSETDAVAFQFNDIDNEVVDVFCWDQYTNDSGKFLITQTAFPLLENIQGFRDGDFGTSGDFGVLDFITMIAIIISMVGLNRVNESVGVVFSILIIGGLAVFGIIEWPTIMTASIVLIAMVIIASTRKE